MPNNSTIGCHQGMSYISGDVSMPYWLTFTWQFALGLSLCKVCDLCQLKALINIEQKIYYHPVESAVKMIGLLTVEVSLELGLVPVHI